MSGLQTVRNVIRHVSAESLKAQNTIKGLINGAWFSEESSGVKLLPLLPGFPSPQPDTFASVLSSDVNIKCAVVMFSHEKTKFQSTVQSVFVSPQGTGS